MKWAKQQIVKRRSKRDLIPLRARAKSDKVRFNDVRWPQMWYLVSVNNHTLLTERKLFFPPCEIKLSRCKNNADDIKRLKLSLKFILNLGISHFLSRYYLLLVLNPGNDNCFLPFV